MVAAIPTTASRLLFSGSRSSLSRFSPSQLCALRAKTLISYSSNNNKIHDGPGAGGVSVEVRCSARATTTRTAYEIETLTTWLLKEEMAGNIDSELAIVLSSISLACKQIASLLQRSSITNLTGLQGTVNVQGEDQKKLDVVSNEVFCNCLRSSGRTGIIASEEEDVPVAVEETYSGNYIVVFDPIDGSANIDTALTTGSIFGIYRPDDQCLVDIDDNESVLNQVEQKCIVNVCQPGSNLLGAGYCMYSSSVIFVLSIGKGVFAFTLDPLYGEFVLTREHQGTQVR